MTEIDWRAQRRSGIAAIAASFAASLALGLALLHFLPPLAGMDDLAARILVALKCLAGATLFSLVAGIEAVAHERLQSNAFDPLAGHQSERLRVNQRYLQNTLEQLVVFAVALFGLAAYLDSGEAMRIVVAITVIWVLNRWAFWVGYHRSAAMRGLGAAGVLASMVALLYVAARIGFDVAGTIGAVATIGAFLVLEALLFRKTR